MAIYRIKNIDGNTVSMAMVSRFSFILWTRFSGGILSVIPLNLGAGILPVATGDLGGRQPVIELSWFWACGGFSRGHVWLQEGMRANPGLWIRVELTMGMSADLDLQASWLSVCI